MFLWSKSFSRYYVFISEVEHLFGRFLVDFIQTSLKFLRAHDCKVKSCMYVCESKCVKVNRVCLLLGLPICHCSILHSCLYKSLICLSFFHQYQDIS